MVVVKEVNMSELLEQLNRGEEERERGKLYFVDEDAIRRDRRHRTNTFAG